MPHALRSKSRLGLLTLAAAAPLLASPHRAASAVESPAAHAVLDAWMAAFNAHDLARLDALYEKGAAVAGVRVGGWVEDKGPGAAGRFVAPFFTAFPDVRVAPTHVYHKGDMLAVEWVSDGTHKGSLNGAPPTGKRAGIAGVSLFWFDAKGLIKRSESLFDEATLAQQLGLAPGPARAIPSWPSAPATWTEADANERKTVAAAKASWPTSWSKHDRKGYEAVLDDGSAHIEVAGPNDFVGKAALLAEYDMYAKAIPDMKVKVAQAWAFGDVAILKFTFSGTMRGAIGPFPATNKTLTIHGIDVDTMAGTKMMKGVTYSNGVDLLAQFGVLTAAK